MRECDGSHEASHDPDCFLGYLRTQIGKKVQILFFITAINAQVSGGILHKVGANYIALKDEHTSNITIYVAKGVKYVTTVS